MKVLKIDETDMEKTGYAKMEVEITEEERDFFIEYAIIDIIKKGMEAHEDNFRPAVSDTE